MSFGGSVIDMISRNKQNAALRNNRREIYRTKSDYFSNNKRNSSSKEIIELTQEEKDKLDIKIVKALKRKKFMNKVLPIYIFSYVLIATIIIVLMIINS